MSLINHKKTFQLIGEMKPQFSAVKLPTNQQVLQVLFYKTRYLKKAVKESIRDVIQEVQSIWDKAIIPTKSRSTCILLLEKLYDEYHNLQKFKNKSNYPQIKETLIYKLNMLFDIAQEDVIQVLDEEKKTFLLSQRSNQKYGFISCLMKDEKEIVSSGVY